MESQDGYGGALKEKLIAQTHEDWKLSAFNSLHCLEICILSPHFLEAGKWAYSQYSQRGLGWMKWILIGALAASLAASAKPEPGAHSQHADAGNGTAKPSQYLPVAPPSPMEGYAERIAKALEAKNTRETSYAEQKNAGDYLQTQQDMAKYAGRMFWVGVSENALTLVGLILLGATLYYTKRAATAAEKSVKVTRDVGRSQARAYVGVSSARVDFVNLGVGEQPAITLTFRNTGPTPARDVRWTAAVQFIWVEKRRTRWLTPMSQHENWATCEDIAGTGTTTTNRAIVSDMFPDKFPGDPDNKNIGLRILLEFTFVDVFKKKISGHAYFLGHAHRLPEGHVVRWGANISPSAKPNDWDGPDKE